MKILLTTLLSLVYFFSLGQGQIPMIENIDLDLIEQNSIKKYWLKMIDDGLSQPVCIPIIIAKGNTAGPVFGMTAAIHGNELNGIKVIQEVFENIDVNTLNGTIIGIPGLNAISIPQHKRRYVDDEDLNRNFPGKKNGNRSQHYAWQITEKVLPNFDYLVDMHTASFGRENTLYVRGDLSDQKIAVMAQLQDADIILNNKGVPSTGDQIAATRTMRAEAMLKGIPTITVEYGNPQVYQPDMIRRGVTGISNILSWLGMKSADIVEVSPATQCEKSYWVYIDKGGLLEILVDLNQRIKKDEHIATLRNPFGDVIKHYYSPQDGIVIGKSSNPVNMSGGRIIHLGIIDSNK